MQIFRLLLPLLLIAGCATTPIAIVQPPTYVKSPAPTYPALARRQGIQGVVELRMQVLANGLSGNVEIWKSSGSSLLDAAAVESAKKTAFLPARTASGAAVDSWIRLPIRFELEGPSSTGRFHRSQSFYDTSIPYAKRLADAVKYFLVDPGPVSPQSMVEVEVVTEPSGNVTSFKLLRSEGSAQWEGAVLRAMAKLDRLPLDSDGKIPPQLSLLFRP
jgi:periplasmic protein TonB